ncbi:AMP-binding protein [Aestuariibaculum sediminum]|uniref:AMP-binding protein n=1 Tax=Aestuariibaculum sediminum TaxID=2770637 RepID=A0A8J6Q039_9FLAO|nr:AMP-binding protein [Aestuariibaculum sediminum]MBD0832117.1 AMP-binding protein [Aestuariibaculum sediminum]
MQVTYQNIHPKFKIEGFHYTKEYLLELAYDFVKEGKPFEKEIGNFLFQWLDNHETIKVTTSGSTGNPKTIEISKQAMVNSALATGDFFNLKPGNKALCCLPATYIAGKMMLVRAIILGLDIDIVEPASEVTFNTKSPYHFCAMVPMQVEHVLDKLDNIETLILGGVAVPDHLKTKLQKVKTKVFETYGMTETVTHIALKPLNHNKYSDFYFHTVPGVTVSSDNRECLVIEAPKISSDKIVTNDIVKIHSNTMFEWLGRFDNVINSGGIKLFPEQIEKKLQGKLKERFFVASESDQVLGERLILVIEANSNSLDKKVFSELNKFEKPKAIYAVHAFAETNSGKIQRKKTLQLINK